MPKLLLIDGHSQAYRAYFGVKTPLMTQRGELTTAIFGFTRKLLSILKEYAPDYVAVAFDVGDTWRHAEFPDYKATRERMPDDMRTQMERIEELLRAFNIPIVTAAGFEADDVLGTLARQADEQGVDVYILTGDRDMFQLVSERVCILYTKGGPTPTTDPYGPAEIQERYGLTTSQFIEMKALVGDSSDNIPGIVGVGEKSAIKFLQEYGSIDGLYAHIDAVRGPKTQESVREAEEQVRRNVRLVTIGTDLDGVTFDPESFRLKDWDRAGLRRLFEELEFRSFIRELNLDEGRRPELVEGPVTVEEEDDSGQLSLFAEDAPARSATPAAAVENPYLTVTAAAALQEVVAKLSAAPLISFDVETTGTDPMQAALVGLGVAWAKGEAAYIPVAHGQGTQLAWEQVRTALSPLFADASRPKVAHNAKYDAVVCIRHGLDVAGPIHDTMTLAWLLDSASRSLGLKSTADRELGWRMTEISQLIGSGRKQITIDQAPIEQVGAYCGADCDATLQLYHLLQPRVRGAGLWSLYDSIELPLLPVLAKMEMAGIRLDTDFLGEMSTDLAERLLHCEKRLYEIAGHEFNLRSTQQLSQVLFGEMGFPTRGLKKTQTGFISTAAGELEKLAGFAGELSAHQHEALTLILDQRQLEKLRGTYVDALPELVNPQTGRLHTSYNQTGSSTGRLSSNSPNLQNIPIRTEMGREIRKAFVAAQGWLLLAADYSQVELRILAHVTQEPGLLEAFRQDQDIHAATASKLFDVAIDEVDRSQRGLAKTINFATIYGVSAYGLSSRSEMGPVEAQRFLDQYFATYPRVRTYIDDTIRKATEDGYVETLLGRKRFFPELQTKLPFTQRQALERAAINAPIQGTAADVIKIAMIRLHKRLQEEGFQARMLLQVHDELVLEMPETEREAVTGLVREVMESAYTLDIPLKVDAEVGPNWYEMEKT
ncbi:MAG: DNA polymerase I [Chloroflexi bacterium]|nr:DNA polymerase I [Chloroflexota bacterium]